MIRSDNRARVSDALLLLTALTVGSYFAFAAVQGDHGLFRRIQIEAEAVTLAAERDRLANDLAELQNLTRRLSDQWLDLDLLDERTRNVLGYLRADEVVSR